MSRLILILSACAVSGLIGLPVLGLHTKNAGPAKFELKFKLPPPQPLTPEEALRAFQLEPGFRIELVAAEPLVEAPVAMSFDDQGRIYVVEMRGYMRDLAGSTEGEPTGRIKLLEDTNGDGRMDKASVFMDKLVMPRSVLAVNGGALVAVPPNLFFCKDTDGDGKADLKEVVATDFGTAGGQPEHMANSPMWAMDNAIWSAGYGASFRLRGGIWQRGAGLSRGQWGLCQDDYGRLFFNYNSDLLRCDLLPAEAFARHPLMRNAVSVNARVVKDQTVWPAHPTPGVNRGYDDKTLRADGTLSRATAACGAVIYRGGAFPSAYHGNAFVAEPAANLVKRLRLSEHDGVVTAENARQDREFLTSTDERFRPVQATNGPDGAVYVVDMYRGIIQHSSFLTHYLIANIEDRKLEQPWDCGRIWRIVPDKRDPLKPVRMPPDTASRVAMLSHPNGWVRDTAQRLLVESGDAASAAPALAKVLHSEKSSPLARLHALWALNGLGALTADWQRQALLDANAQVRAAAVRVASSDVTADLLQMTSDKDFGVLAQLAIKLSALSQPETELALAKLLTAGGGKSALVREGALTGMRGREAAFAKVLAAQTDEGKADSAIAVFEEIANLVVMANKAQPFEDLLALAANRPGGDLIQFALLNGLGSGGNSGGKLAAPAKLLWLERQPDALAELERGLSDRAAVKLVGSIREKLAWPGKPGAPPPPKTTPLTPEQMALFEKGRVIYSSLCAACHQPHGFGLDGLAPPLVDSEWVLGKPETAALIVMNGLGGPIKVGSRTWNLAMPPLPHLTDGEVAAVLTYIRREWEHNAAPVNADWVQDLRAKHKERALMWTAEELKKQ